ncbi:hypothetical protein J7U46_17360 [Pelomonas sp. V22]|uniref:hypothetical protein n=1 Tax=Pelomonas sp. V22 TaxID=2822139 RepID=UPI0024A81D66|nr:hypothetical protein [Pelomonas sp. V22]MDI4634833.1 hypothetical protein [Pelomonas sp. V22]
MMAKTGRIIVASMLAALAAGLMAGCGTPSESLSMGLSPADALQMRAWVPDALRQNVALGPVTGGQATNRWWGSKVSSQALEQAFEDSLRAVGMFPLVREAGRYQLDIKLTDLDQPLVSLDTTVRLGISYTLVERSSKATVYQRTVRNAATVEIGDKLLPVERLRLANEAAIRDSIKLVLRDLLALQLPPATAR